MLCSIRISSWYSRLSVHFKAQLTIATYLLKDSGGKCFSQDFKLCKLKECCLQLVILHQTHLIFYLKNIHFTIKEIRGNDLEEFFCSSICQTVKSEFWVVSRPQRTCVDKALDVKLSDCIDCTAASYLKCLLFG